MKTILVMGQSNAIGRISGPITTGTDVAIWDNTNDIDTLSSVGSAFQSANLSSPPHVNGKPMFATAAAKYLSELINEPVRVIVVAKGSTSIDQWHNGTNAGAMYARMAAVLAAAGVSSLDAFLWHQGESDIATAGTYAARFAALHGRMISDGYLTASTPVVVGEISNVASVAMNGVIRGLASASVGVAKIGQFRVNLSDNWHFDGPSIAPIGLEYAYELSQLPGAWFGTWCPSPATNGFVFGTGGAVSLLSGVDTRAPVYFHAGNADYLTSDGYFVAPSEGLWRFDYRAHGEGGKLRAKLINGEGQEIDFGAYSGGSDLAGNNPIITGVSYMRLWRGDKVGLSVNQASGVTRNFAHEFSQRFLAVSASFVSP